MQQEHEWEIDLGLLLAKNISKKKKFSEAIT